MYPNEDWTFFLIIQCQSQIKIITKLVESNPAETYTLLCTIPTVHNLSTIKVNYFYVHSYICVYVIKLNVSQRC